MRKKISIGQQQSHDNPATAALETTKRMTNEQVTLSQRNHDLEKENAALQDKLDEIADIVERNDPVCSPEDHLQDIANICRQR
jgi:hypothetical protein